jgi:hypothetical protein
MGGRLVPLFCGRTGELNGFAEEYQTSNSKEARMNTKEWIAEKARELAPLVAELVQQAKLDPLFRETDTWCLLQLSSADAGTHAPDEVCEWLGLAVAWRGDGEPCGQDEWTVDVNGWELVPFEDLSESDETIPASRWAFFWEEWERLSGDLADALQKELEGFGIYRQVFFAVDDIWGYEGLFCEAGDTGPDTDILIPWARAQVRVWLPVARRLMQEDPYPFLELVPGAAGINAWDEMLEELGLVAVEKDDDYEILPAEAAGDRPRVQLADQDDPETAYYRLLPYINELAERLHYQLGVPVEFAILEGGGDLGYQIGPRQEVKMTQNTEEPISLTVPIIYKWASEYADSINDLVQREIQRGIPREGVFVTLVENRRGLDIRDLALDELSLALSENEYHEPVVVLSGLFRFRYPAQAFDLDEDGFWDDLLSPWLDELDYQLGRRFEGYTFKFYVSGERFGFWIRPR